MPLLPWLLNLVYLLLLLAAAPVVLYRMLVHGKYRDGWSEKLFGGVPRRSSDAPCVWLHAVSVGEVLQLRTVLAELRERRPDLEILITTTTATGHAVAREKYPECRVCYFPLDFSWAVRRAIRRVRPDLIVLVELELWPNFILAAKEPHCSPLAPRVDSGSRSEPTTTSRSPAPGHAALSPGHPASGTPLALINGRVSENSFRGYSRLRPLMRRLLANFDLLAAQTPVYAERLQALGAPPERLCVTGSIKFDHVATDRQNPKTQELRQTFGIAEHERVFIAGSTQAPEEEYALDAWLASRDEFPDLRLVLVPRHKERFEEVARLVEARGLPLVRRSRAQESEARSQKSGKGALNHNGQRTTDNGRPPSSQLSRLNSQPVLLLDTLGELAACWGLAEIAFVGGSLTRRGGQNMIEPAAYGAAVLFGPNTWNFRDVVEVLLAGEAARVVTGPEDLTRAVASLLRDPPLARAQGERAQRLVLAQQGATRRTVEELVRLLPDAADACDASRAA